MKQTLRVGLLVPHQGPAGLWTPSARACARLAVSEINTASGILDREVELIVADAGSTGRSAAEAARQAIDIDCVDALIGMFPSYARPDVIHAVGDIVPFIYTPQFEGFEHNPHVVTTGETSSELLRPALTWLVEEKRAQRFFLCGSDYVWPRTTFASAKRMIAALGGSVTGEVYAALEDHDYGAIFAAVRATRADVVLPCFLGSDAIAFNRAFAAAGLASKTLRYASAIDETIVYALEENETENLFISSGYLSAVQSRNNGAFLERYHTSYGDNPPPANSYGQSCYEGIYCLAALADCAGSLDAAHLRSARGRSRQSKTARGLEARPVAGSRHPIYLARVDGHDMTVLRTPQQCG